MTKIPNGNWEDDKEIYHQALQDGIDILEILEAVYKYGLVDGYYDGMDAAVEILEKSGINE